MRRRSSRKRSLEILVFGKERLNRLERARPVLGSGGMPVDVGVLRYQVAARLHERRIEPYSRRTWSLLWCEESAPVLLGGDPHPRELLQTRES
jgi:hypothetical protein